MEENNPHVLGNAPIGKLLLQYSIPAIIGMTLTSLYNIIDSIFIGHGVGALAIHTIFNCVAHIIGPGKNKHLSGSLYPEIHHNKPGRYRFFYPVTFTDTGRDVTLMAEFRLTDNPKDWQKDRRKRDLPYPLLKITDQLEL